MISLYIIKVAKRIIIFQKEEFQMKKINWKKIVQLTMVVGVACYGYYLWTEALRCLGKFKKSDFVKEVPSEEKPEEKL